MRSFFVAKALVEAGFEVELITTHNQKKYILRNIEGIKVHYLPIFYKNEWGFAKRIFAFLKYALQSFLLAKRLLPAYFIFATSTPLTIGIPALFLKKLYKVPFIFEVRDIWPQIPIEMGIIKNPLLKKLLLSFEKKIYQNASKVVALSPEIKKHILSKTPQKPVAIIPNMADIDFFQTTENSDFYKRKLNLPNKFLIGYFGAISQANHLEYLWELAEYFLEKEESRVHCIVIGEGKSLKKLKQKKPLNVSIFPNKNKLELREYLNAVEAIYSSFLNLPILTSGSPNKFFDGLAAGKICITNIQSWIKNIIEKNECGFYAPPNSPEITLQKIQKYLENPNLIQNHQKNALKLAEKEFSRKLLCKKYIDFFK